MPPGSSGELSELSVHGIGYGFPVVSRPERAGSSIGQPSGGSGWTAGHTASRPGSAPLARAGCASAAGAGLRCASAASSPAATPPPPLALSVFATEAVRIHILTVPPQSNQTTGAGVRGAVEVKTAVVVNTAEAHAQVPSPTQLGLNLSPAAAALLEHEGAPEHWDATSETSEEEADSQGRWQHEFTPPAAEDVQPASAGALPWVPAEQQWSRQQAYHVAAESSSDGESHDSLSSSLVDRASTPAALLPVPALAGSHDEGAIRNQPDAWCGPAEDSLEAAEVQEAQLQEQRLEEQQLAAEVLPLQAQLQPEETAEPDGAGQQSAASRWCRPAEIAPEATRLQQAPTERQKLEEQQPAAAMPPLQGHLQAEAEAQPREACQHSAAIACCGPAEEAPEAAGLQEADTGAAQLAQQQPAAALLPVQAQVQTDDAEEAGSEGDSPAEQPTLALQHTLALTVPSSQQQREAPLQQHMALVAVPALVQPAPPLLTFPAQQLQAVLGSGLSNMRHRLQDAAVREGALRMESEMAAVEREALVQARAFAEAGLAAERSAWLAAEQHLQLLATDMQGEQREWEEQMAEGQGQLRVARSALRALEKKVAGLQAELQVEQARRQAAEQQAEQARQREAHLLALLEGERAERQQQQKQQTQLQQGMQRQEQLEMQQQAQQQQQRAEKGEWQRQQAEQEQQRQQAQQQEQQRRQELDCQQAQQQERQRHQAQQQAQQEAAWLLDEQQQEERRQEKLTQQQRHTASGPDSGRMPPFGLQQGDSTPARSAQLAHWQDATTGSAGSAALDAVLLQNTVELQQDLATNKAGADRKGPPAQPASQPASATPQPAGAGQPGLQATTSYLRAPSVQSVPAVQTFAGTTAGQPWQQQMHGQQPLQMQMPSLGRVPSQGQTLGVPMRVAGPTQPVLAEVRSWLHQQQPGQQSIPQSFWQQHEGPQPMTQSFWQQHAGQHPEPQLSVQQAAEQQPSLWQDEGASQQMMQAISAMSHQAAGQAMQQPCPLSPGQGASGRHTAVRAGAEHWYLPLDELQHQHSQAQQRPHQKQQQQQQQQPHGQQQQQQHIQQHQHRQQPPPVPLQQQQQQQQRPFSPSRRPLHEPRGPALARPASAKRRLMQPHSPSRWDYRPAWNEGVRVDDLPASAAAARTRQARGIGEQAASQQGQYAHPPPLATQQAQHPPPPPQQQQQQAGIGGGQPVWGMLWTDGPVPHQQLQQLPGQVDVPAPCSAFFTPAAPAAPSVSNPPSSPVIHQYFGVPPSSSPPMALYEQRPQQQFQLYSTSPAPAPDPQSRPLTAGGLQYGLQYQMVMQPGPAPGHAQYSQQQQGLPNHLVAQPAGQYHQPWQLYPSPVQPPPQQQRPATPATGLGPHRYAGSATAATEAWNAHTTTTTTPRPRSAAARDKPLAVPPTQVDEGSLAAARVEYLLEKDRIRAKRLREVQESADFRLL